jgi:hypothetical protein
VVRWQDVQSENRDLSSGGRGQEIVQSGEVRINVRSVVIFSHQVCSRCGEGGEASDVNPKSPGGMTSCCAKRLGITKSRGIHCRGTDGRGRRGNCRSSFVVRRSSPRPSFTRCSVRWPRPDYSPDFASLLDPFTPKPREKMRDSGLASNFRNGKFPDRQPRRSILQVGLVVHLTFVAREGTFRFGVASGQAGAQSQVGLPRRRFVRAREESYGTVRCKTVRSMHGTSKDTKATRAGRSGRGKGGGQDTMVMEP